ncbi:hypothetical protein CGG88_12020 [Vibrio parahaemolyticus]|uniref:tetratricopeptide repeat protein n=1 Tax=Vibrio parahaemolyticus TaxID=670 RepID=UPI00111D130F|nr:tetratricopeptide repeat protein [Vibrio parahaemolyticus]TOQ81088.1 hypothetical protein CGG88_12020 [Vibrio parahaemolyticus]
MNNEILDKIKNLKKRGKHEDAYKIALKYSTCHPNDAIAQLSAAYAADRLGFEKEAVKFYEKAELLGVPEAETCEFLLCFGSTLRNIGRVNDAICKLHEAAEKEPERPEIKAFLSLALHSAGHYNESLASMLEAALQASSKDAFGPYYRALLEYKRELSKLK